MSLVSDCPGYAVGSLHDTGHRYSFTQRCQDAPVSAGNGTRARLSGHEAEFTTGANQGPVVPFRRRRDSQLNWSPCHQGCRRRRVEGVVTVCARAGQSRSENPYRCV